MSVTTSATARSTARGRGMRPLIALLALLGVLTLVYPTAARWFSDRRHTVEISGYAEEVDRLPDAQGRAILAAAAAYNDDLPTGPLRGVSLANGTASSTGETGAGYRQQLAVPGTDVMASIGIPAIGLDLPIRHGTDEGTLGRGVGHLAGSSLPIGGEGTHAVLTGHSGLVGSSMFDDLHDLEVGDDVVLTALGAVARYEIDSIEVVTPDSTAGLRIEPGEDRLTLVTCTPIGVNSHRLLIHAQRVPDVSVLDDGSLGGSGIVAGFPWWAVVAGSTVAGALATALPRGRRPSRHRAVVAGRAHRGARGEGGGRGSRGGRSASGPADGVVRPVRRPRRPGRRRPPARAGAGPRAGSPAPRTAPRGS